jgi:hypothetical protein
MVTSHMTTVQEPPNGHHPLPPPCSFPDTHNENGSEDSIVSNSNGDSSPASATHGTKPLAANSYHVPPKQYAPRVSSYQGDDFSSFVTDPNPLPDRCQFMFSDGRQCTMARSDIHPSLCRFHSEREDQLFGSPTAGGHVVGAAFDLPELYSACRDLTTAAGVNRALGQVFRLLAQRRISRQEAATFGHLAQLLLRSISAMRAESTASASENKQPMIPVVERQKGVAITPLLPQKEVALSSLSSSRESHGDQELSRVNEVADPIRIGVPSEQCEPRDLSEGPAAPPPLACVDATSGGAGAAPAPQKANAATCPGVESAFSRPTNVAHAASPNSQPSQNEQMCGARLQLAQNEHLPNFST